MVSLRQQQRNTYNEGNATKKNAKREGNQKRRDKGERDQDKLINKQRSKARFLVLILCVNDKEKYTKPHTHTKQPTLQNDDDGESYAQK